MAQKSQGFHYAFGQAFEIAFGRWIAVIYPDRLDACITRYTKTPYMSEVRKGGRLLKVICFVF